MKKSTDVPTAMDALPEWRIDAMGAYLAYVQHPWADESSINAAERLARDYGVVTLPGEYFGPGQVRHLRVAFANVVSEIIALLPGQLST